MTLNAKQGVFMRYASPNERRTITREDLGFYHSVVIGAVYKFEDGGIDLRSARSYMSAVRSCIDEHPFLNVIVKDGHTEKPFYERVLTIHLENHISVAEGLAGIDEDKSAVIKSIEAATVPLLDHLWPSDRPPWRIVVHPFPSAQSTDLNCCFVAFSFSHALSDGIAGLAFHRTFLDAIRVSGADNELLPVVTSGGTLPAPFDTPERLPISWDFLLGPLIAVCVPKLIANFFGLRAALGKIDAGSWTGRPVFYKGGDFHTRLRILEIEDSLVQKALQVTRKHDAKLTATLHQLIVRALSRALPAQQITNFVSQTAVNMRRSVGALDNEMGCFVTGYYDVHPRTDSTTLLSEEAWGVASKMTKKLAESATRLDDQPIGLLRFAPSIRKYLTGKIGQDRDCSYEVSNLVAFSDKEQDNGRKITKMIFAQPANVVSSPLVFSFVSVQGGSLICSVSWQQGALGLATGEEGPFVDGICESMRADLESLK
ncbi:alcohol acetyltransferase [Xylariales sp. AK1849]|nr:alcohol acetyltransferase [Xylariales sp. AK1849]